jgi:glutathione S-transferase
MRVRWALEEVGQLYKVRLLSFGEMKEPAHRRLHPFGQIPAYEEGTLALFESEAIVFHIAERHAGLLPKDAGPRARAITWMFAALRGPLLGAPSTINWQFSLGIHRAADKAMLWQHGCTL